MEIEVPAGTLKKVRGGAKTFPVPSTLPIGEATALAWGTLARLRSGADNDIWMICPARFASAGAHLSVLAAQWKISSKHGPSATLG